MPPRAPRRRTALVPLALVLGVTAATGTSFAPATAAPSAAYEGPAAAAEQAPDVTVGPHMSWPQHAGSTTAPATSTPPRASRSVARPAPAGVAAPKRPPARPAPSKAVPVTNARLSARFGQSGRMWSSGRHTGLDFAAPTGTPVMSASTGTVVSAGRKGPYGNAIEVRTGETTFLYAHLSRIGVRPGQKVVAGQVVGKVGSTGNTSGPHLHLEVARNGNRIDPATYLWGRSR